MFLQVVGHSPLCSLVRVCVACCSDSYEVYFGVHSPRNEIAALAVVCLGMSESAEFSSPYAYKRQDLVLVALTMAYCCEGLLLVCRIKAPQANAVIGRTGYQDVWIGW
jgi:hypothetical protein